MSLLYLQKIYIINQKSEQICHMKKVVEFFFIHPNSVAQQNLIYVHNIMTPTTL